MKRLVPLECAAERVCGTGAVPPFIFQLPPEEGRKRLNEAQDAPVFKYPAEIRTILFDTGAYGVVNVHCVIPENLPRQPQAIFYIHGAGWVFGNLHTHEKLVRELAHRTGCALFFPEYSLSPEAKYPIAIEQCYAALETLPALSQGLGVHVSLDKLTVAGDSAGGNMATAITIMSKRRSGPKIHKQLMYYPVTNAAFNTQSYNMFARDYYLCRAGMMWFWDQYTMNERKRAESTASPLRAGLDELSGLPQAMILNGEADVLRDEGESYARRLRQAGVQVTAMRFQAMIHDFVMLNALDRTNACRAAMSVSTQWIRERNES